jgi:hypothetical protein
MQPDVYEESLFINWQRTTPTLDSRSYIVVILRRPAMSNSRPLPFTAVEDWASVLQSMQPEVYEESLFINFWCSRLLRLLTHDPPPPPSYFTFQNLCRLPLYKLWQVQCTDYNLCNCPDIWLTIIHTHGDSWSYALPPPTSYFNFKTSAVYRCIRLGKCTRYNQCNRLLLHLTHDHTYSWGLMRTHDPAP